jgi:hypothetical protein
MSCALFGLNNKSFLKLYYYYYIIAYEPAWHNLIV